MREFGMTELGAKFLAAASAKSISDGQPDGHWILFDHDVSQPAGRKKRTLRDGPVRQKPDDPGIGVPHSTGSRKNRTRERAGGSGQFGI